MPNHYRRLRKVFFWGTLLLLALAAGGLGFAYSYVTDSATLAAVIRREAPKYLPGCSLQVGRVLVRPLLGQATLTQVFLWQPIDGQPFTTAELPWLSVHCDLNALTQGRFEPTEVIVAQPVLRVKRRKDGTWNLAGLLADPWPAPPLPTDPVLVIKNGTLELTDESGELPAMVLRDLELRTTPAATGPVRFEGSARGGPFDRLRIEGTLDARTGRIELTSGDLTQGELSDTFRRCLPGAARARFGELGLQGGEVDVVLRRLSFDAAAPPERQVVLAASFLLRGATLTRPELPFALTGVEVAGSYEGGTLTIDRAEGRNGKTLVQVRGTLDATAPESGAMDLNVAVTDLELDRRLQDVTPAQFKNLWSEYQPEGWVNVGLKLVRPRPGEPVKFGLTVACEDVGMTFHLFRYPLQHIRGSLVWQGSQIQVDVRTMIGGEWATGKGTIDNPGPDAIVRLDFASRSVPVDEALLKALPADIRKVVDTFHPTGSARGVAHLSRRPPPGPGKPDQVEIHAELDLNEDCSMRWDGLPYLVRDLTGHLDLKPDRWTFQGMKGRNGSATISADGEVVKLGPEPGQEAVTLQVRAEHLPFEPQLRDALPPQWRTTWATLNPSGFSRVEANIKSRPDNEPHYHLKIVPEPAETRVQLVLTPVEGTTPAQRTIQLPTMENVAGTFLYDDGNVIMTDVSCTFREVPVSFKRGEVVLERNGGFRMAVKDLLVTKLRLDAELRRIMPPVMAQFAQRLDDGRSFWIHTDLGIGWSGRPGMPARCEWRNATLVFDGNTIQTGMPVEQLQGQIDHLSGWSDGRTIALNGAVNLASVRLLSQQVTNLSTPLVLADGKASLSNLQGTLLGGKLFGSVDVSLEATPHYRADLQLLGADLARYTMTLPGKQSLRGLLSGRLAIEGAGNDVRTCSGEGSAQISQGDLGQLPLALTWAKVPNFRKPTRTAFDAAEVRATIADGRAVLDPIRFTGDAFSLSGSGTVQLQGEREVDLRLSPLYGRNERRVPLVSDVVQEASNRVLDIHVTGPLAAPKIGPEPLPDVLTRASEVIRLFGERRQGRARTVREGTFKAP